MPKFGQIPVHDHADAPGGGTIAHSATTGQAATDHHTAAILESLLTTRGDSIVRDASGPVRLAIGTDDQHYRSDGTDIVWETVSGGSGALTRVGGNSTEATTTSTSAVDLMTVSSLTIAALTPFMLALVHRKTSGAAASSNGGLKLNATVVAEAAGGLAKVFQTSATDRVERGYAMVHVGPRLTNYERSAVGVHGNYSSGILEVIDTAPVNSADMPTVEITDVIIRGLVSNASVTCAVDELHIYEFATS